MTITPEDADELGKLVADHMPKLVAYPKQLYSYRIETAPYDDRAVIVTGTEARVVADVLAIFDDDGLVAAVHLPSLKRMTRSPVDPVRLTDEHTDEPLVKVDDRPWVKEHGPDGCWHFFPDGHYKPAVCGHGPIPGSPYVGFHPRDSNVCSTCKGECKRQWHLAETHYD